MRGPSEGVYNQVGAVQVVHAKMEVNWGKYQGEGNQDCTPKRGQREAFLLGPG